MKLRSFLKTIAVAPVVAVAASPSTFAISKKQTDGSFVLTTYQPTRFYFSKSEPKVGLKRQITENAIWIDTKTLIAYVRYQGGWVPKEERDKAIENGGPAASIKHLGCNPFTGLDSNS